MNRMAREWSFSTALVATFVALSVSGGCTTQEKKTEAQKTEATSTVAVENQADGICADSHGGLAGSFEQRNAMADARRKRARIRCGGNRWQTIGRRFCAGFGTRANRSGERQ